MHEIDLRRLDLNLLVTFEVLMAEHSVTRAAERLLRTQSAVSHALARLREQLDDPLLVKVGGRMRPSPYAERLLEDLQPLLRGIQRVLAPAEAFVPAVSTRAFTIAISDIAPSLFPRLMARVRAEAPGVAVDWVAEGSQTLLAVAEGHVDVAFVASAVPLPEGLATQEAGAIGWASYARADHPAWADWSAGTWARQRHVLVHVPNALPSPVSAAGGLAGHKRKVGARVLNFSAVPLLLARTDLIATLPTVVMHEALERYGLAAKAPPFTVAPMPHRFVWSARLTKDPASRWIRGHLAGCFAEVLRESSAQARRRRRGGGR